MQRHHADKRPRNATPTTPICGSDGHPDGTHMDPHGPTRCSFVAKKVRLPGARTIRCRVVDRDGRGHLWKRTSTPTRPGACRLVNDDRLFFWFPCRRRA